MKELIGCVCQCEFNLPPNEWPIRGCPAWVIVLNIDGNMIKLASGYGDPKDSELWCSTSFIKTIKRVRKCQPTQ